jgi:hypothetical protein
MPFGQSAAFACRVELVPPPGCADAFGINVSACRRPGLLDAVRAKRGVPLSVRAWKPGSIGRCVTATWTTACASRRKGERPPEW